MRSTNNSRDRLDSMPPTYRISISCLWGGGSAFRQRSNASRRSSSFDNRWSAKSASSRRRLSSKTSRSRLYFRMWFNALNRAIWLAQAQKSVPVSNSLDFSKEQNLLLEEHLLRLKNARAKHLTSPLNRVWWHAMRLTISDEWGFGIIFGSAWLMSPES